MTGEHCKKYLFCLKSGNGYWVVQEISFAPKTLLVSGNDELDWDAVDAVLGAGKYYTDAFHSPFVHGSGADIKTTFTNAQIVKNQREAVREMQQGGESKLLDVLARFRTTKSTDPRDKVYALLGLVSDHLGLEVDYRKPHGKSTSMLSDVSLIHLQI